MLTQRTILKPGERAVLFDMMGRANTGAKRIRSGVPSGTELRHKTGTGNNAVNDVGLITLPAKHGHIALAVMISDSKLTKKSGLSSSKKLLHGSYCTATTCVFAIRGQLGHLSPEFHPSDNQPQRVDRCILHFRVTLGEEIGPVVRPENTGCLEGCRASVGQLSRAEAEHRC